MVFTVAVVVVNAEAFVDPRLDRATPLIREIFNKTAHNRDSFGVLATSVLPQKRDEISSTLKDLIEKNSFDWILVVGGIGFQDSDQTPEAIDSLIERPAVAVVNRILANVLDPFLLRPSAGTSKHSLITSLPESSEDVQRVLNDFISAPGFLRLLDLLKNGQTTAQQPIGPERSAPTVNPVTREISPSTPQNTILVQLPLEPPQPVITDSPWRSFGLRVEARNPAPSTSTAAPQSNVSSLVWAECTWFSLVPSPSQHLYMFGGYGDEATSVRRLDLDSQNSVATFRNVRGAGDAPSLRYGHRAVMISSSLMVIWGGYISDARQLADNSLHIFDLETVTWSTLQTAGPAPCSRYHHAMVAAGQTLYIYGGRTSPGHGAGALSDFWSFDFNQLIHPQRRKSPQWQDLSWTLNKSEALDSPGPQQDHRLCMNAENIFLLGTPLNKHGSSKKSAVYSFSLETSTWVRCCSSGLDGKYDGGAVLLGDTIYCHSTNDCKMYSISNKKWLDNPSKYSRKDLKGPMVTIDSKVYVFGKSVPDTSKFALYELDIEKIWPLTSVEHALAQALRR